MEQLSKEPIRFKAYIKNVIWGGDKILNLKNIPLVCDKVGESWEISAVPGHVSVVESGQYAGLSLTDLIDRFGPQLLGERVYNTYQGQFPLLVKLIDARENLSVQVRPDDALAKERHNCPGKTEMWYIIDADENAKIYSGLNQALTPERYEQIVGDGTFADVLAVHESSPGDVFFLPARRVHAIGAGNMLDEIQESSDITYRIFDYNRRDANGVARPLHTELAKDAIDFTVHDSYKSESPAESESDAPLVECAHFKVRRVLVSGSHRLAFAPDSFTIVMCLDGEISLDCGGTATTIAKGQTVLLPAILSSACAHGSGTLLTAQA